MKLIRLDAGRSDEYYLDLGAVAFAQEVERAGATCTLELFDGAHGGLTYRYPGAIRALVEALAPQSSRSPRRRGTTPPRRATGRSRRPG